MKKIITIFSIIVLASCSPNDTVIEKYEVKIINGVETNNRRGTTKLCGDVTESGTEQLPGVDLHYYWVVVCRPKM